MDWRQLPEQIAKSTMTPDPETLGCREHEEDNGKFDSHGFSLQRPVARRAARVNATPGALAKALEFADKYICDEKCPQKKLTIWLSHVYGMSCSTGQVQVPGLPAPINAEVCTCYCDWRVRIDCVKDQFGQFSSGDADPPEFDEFIEPDEHGFKPQDLDCDEEFGAKGKAFGVGNGLTAKDATDAARASLSDNVKDVIDAASGKVNCSKRSCPDRKLTVLIGPAAVAATKIQGKQGVGIFMALASCDWAIKVECVS